MTANWSIIKSVSNIDRGIARAPTNLQFDDNDLLVL
jgi:hypothetical protein